MCPVRHVRLTGDAPVDVFQSALGKRPYGAKCVYQRFDDQVGFGVRITVLEMQCGMQVWCLK